ncbi:hypothetical protein ACTXL6_17960 [Brachybacterium tyrofermentans]|uniref:hypothetical protein n=1 Tax=Brachybacterium tyrofermentans TaxID=47848 RepID=UPI003FD3242A
MSATSVHQSYVVEQPRLVGSRSSAVERFAHLPRAGVGTVFLRCERMEAASQSFADETVAQVLCARNTRQRVVIAPTTRFARHLQGASLRRGVADRLEVTLRL